ncbi:hypothetical protein PC129_g13392 [Phytophthora cactorum]|uniref:Uncharacterized protein n=1 Tax=Phytophthora cactorum TaxID=29920 RepID=A0A329S5L3_9STRA|nr:hypothetical protein Pcac1_g5309 [Phytophthora cactorum]KAG2921955.1 hypothetical protein PC117_g16095 [Phytophthora cactorum]KAG3215736.1 hypothetical protein PC129_g13392 [Phytophthora cactorum]KAG4233771.1 hypothetical protein PC116_g18047 [Phytophthora cactorum]RAW31186.1 hypothetical protein PC110_g12458 [Phytophthora cactorum]
MEEFFQYIGHNGGAASSSALLNRERMFVYSSPREKQIDRCGELRVGSYFACSGVLYYEDQVWLKIRRGYFSNAKNNGYIRVHFEFPTGSTPIDGSDLPPRQHSSVVAAQSSQFRYMRKLPEFPTYMCARDRLVLYREPVFNLHSASVSSSGSVSGSSSAPRHMQRFLPPVSVFQATECRFNQDFTQLAVKVTSAFAGLGGWINASFHKMLIEVEDPKQFGFFRNGPVYLQNVAGRGGKWAGELPVRAIPSLQAPRLYNVESYRVVKAIERKLLKDRVWVRIQPLKSQQELQQGGEKKSEEENPAAEAGENQEDDRETAGPDAWVIERNANTAQRVMVPWGSSLIQDVPANDNAERYYRTVYSRRPLPLRRTADLQAEIVGHLEPGSVFSSTQRVLNDRGRMWIRVALPSEKNVRISKDAGEDDEDNNASYSNPDNNAEEAKEEEEDFEDLGKSVRYGYAIQSNAKTNTCMVQEIPPPGKMNPKQYYQVFLSSDNGQPQKSSNQEGGTTAPENIIAARAEAFDSAKELFYVKNGAILSAIGTVFNVEQGRIWLQVLAAELEPAMRVKHQWPLSDVEQKLNIVYIPMCDPNRSSHETVLKPVHRELTRIDSPLKAEKDNSRSPSRVVFSGRASKLFDSHLLRPSTIDLPSTFQKKNKGPESLSSGINVPDPVARAAGENDHAQSLKDEISAWQLQTGNRVTQLYTQIGSLASYTLSCVRRPFASCLAHQEAKRRYRQLDQEEEGMEEYALDDDDVRV